MMAFPGWSRRARRYFSQIIVVCALGGSMGWARIGDTPEQMAARMLQPDLGRNFSWPKDMDEKAIARAKKENPLFPYEYLLPTTSDEWREQMFWKSALPKKLSNTDGWRVHVYYLRGRSVVEVYRRVGASLNDFEINAILARVRGGQVWRKVDKKDKDTATAADKAADTVLGYDFELGGEDEASLRARKQGDWLIIFHRRFDEYLLARKARWDENETLRKAGERSEQEKTAPVSVEGF